MGVYCMKVLVACEYSGIVRDAFAAKGNDAWSCDILPSESEGNHIQDDVLNHLHRDWDLMIAHPPCTHLSVSGARWFTEGKKPWSLRVEALEFVRKLLNAPVEKIALENPVSVISSHIRKSDQTIQPFQHGHPHYKTTCLWLKNLPKLRPTNVVDVEYVFSKSGRKWTKWFSDTSKLPLKIRGKVRSRFWTGVAKAMAEQWG
jgi:site-specific DNA-cytosine methylase